MKFRVKLRRSVEEIVYVEVEGTDQDDVQEKIDEMDTDELEWQMQDRDPVEIDDVEEI